MSAPSPLAPALETPAREHPVPDDEPAGRPGTGRGGTLPQLAVALVCAVYATGSALGWGSERVALFMGDFGLSVAAAAAAVSCFLYSRSRHIRFRSAWLLFAVSSAMASLGNGVWGWYEVVLGRTVPNPSFADLFFVCFAPPAIVGLLVLAKRPMTKAGWVCLGLDAWLIGGSLLTISWSLALARTAEFDNGAGVAHTALTLAYPLLDIALVSMVLALHFKRSAMNRSAINTAVGALALTVMCDALFTSPLLHDTYHSGQLLDAGWFAGSLLLAYAPWAAPRQPRPEPQQAARPRAGRTGSAAQSHPPAPGVAAGRYPAGRPIAGSIAALTPYLAAGVCTLGILYNILNGRAVDHVVLVTAGAVVLALVVRQGIMLLDNIALTQELAQKENHFRSLVQGSSDVIMIAALNGILRYVSPAASGVYGRCAEDLEGTELAGLIHPEDLGAVVHEVRRFLAATPAEEPTTRIECRFRSGGGGTSRSGDTSLLEELGGEAESGGGWLNVESTISRHHGGLIFNSRDVTERVRLQAQLQHSAEHDPLTDLPNRALFTKRVGQALTGRRASDRGTAVLFIDLDGFKAVNDTIGHQAGDELLVQAARRLQEAVRSGDTAARLGGDEFAALIVGDGSRDRTAREGHILELADRLRLTLSQPYDIDGREVRVAASIGVAFAEPGLGAGELLRNADLAMYRAKAAGKDRVELYAPQMQQDVVRKAEFATRLRVALKDGELALLHQPVVRLADGRVTTVGAQPRWPAAQGLLCTPADLVRAADDGGTRTAELGRWLLEEAVKQAAERAADGYRIPVAVRVGARRIVDRSLPPGFVESLLTRHGLPPGALVIELSGLDPKICLDDLECRLGALRRLGVRIALDGFGSGWAPLTALRRLPLDVLKLDRSLVEGVVESARLHKITRGMLRIAADLGLQSVAEGVDLPEQVLSLLAMGCTHGQGSAFSAPVDEYRLRRVLQTGRYPVPHGPVEPALALGGVYAGRAAAVFGGSGLRSHSETPVPPA